MTLRELAQRAHAKPGRPSVPAGRLPPMLLKPDMTSVRVLKERRSGDFEAVALTVEDQDGSCWLVIRQAILDADEWRFAGGSEGQDRDVPGRDGPFLGLYAYANGGFFAGGRLQAGGVEVAHVRLVWEDGYELDRLRRRARAALPYSLPLAPAEQA